MARYIDDGKVRVHWVPQEPLAANSRQRARDHADARHRAMVRFQSKMSAVSELFGDAIGHVLDRAVEDVIENAVDAAAAWADVVEQQDELLARTSAKNQRLRGVVIDAAVEVQRRYGKRLPDSLRPLVDAGGAVHAYIYPPDDARHRHVTDSGGACRHPQCRYLSDNDPVDYTEEPF